MSKIGPGWFKSNETIYKITIRDAKDANNRSSITDIEPGAFDDCTFREMTELVIRRTDVTVLKRGVFKGAHNLKKITLEENNILRLVEENTLDPLYQLEEVKIKLQKGLEDLLNVTGTTQLKQLRTLTLSFNNFSTSITAETFKGCTHVETLILSNSSIQTIGFGSFDPMAATIQFLDLTNNQLKHLPTNLLTNLIRPGVQIDLSDNLWNCDCDALQLQLWVNESSQIFNYPLVCDMPAWEKNREITEVDLVSICAPDSTTSTQSLDITTNPNMPFVERLNCIDENYASGYLYLEKVYQYFTVKQIGIGKVSVEISSPDATLSMVVINDKDDAQCRYDLHRQMFFENLDPNSVHQFCLIKKESYSTSPKNCYPFHFENTSSIWSHDEIIIALVCSIVLSLVVGILGGWLLNWHYQRVFKAKESLEYNSSPRSSSKTGTEIEDFNSSVTSDYIAGRYGSKSLR